MEQITTRRHRGQLKARQQRARRRWTRPTPDGTQRRRSTRTSRSWATSTRTSSPALMPAITEWVAPEQGCAYCHADGEDLAADSLYTKVVARRMLQMTQHINTDWKPHVAATGVTCYTCHRGQPGAREHLVQRIRAAAGARACAGNQAGQNPPARSLGMASLPYRPVHAVPASRTTTSASSRRRRCPRATAARSSRPSGPTRLMIHMSEGAGRQLHLLPQQPLLLALEPEQPGAGHGLARHPDGPRPERELSRAAASRSSRRTG